MRLRLAVLGTSLRTVPGYARGDLGTNPAAAAKHVQGTQSEGH
jgi:hypothetical protein